MLRDVVLKVQRDVNAPNDDAIAQVARALKPFSQMLHDLGQIERTKISLRYRQTRHDDYARVQLGRKVNTD